MLLIFSGAANPVEVTDGLLFIAAESRLHYRAEPTQAMLYVANESRLHYEARDA